MRRLLGQSQRMTLKFNMISNLEGRKPRHLIGNHQAVRGKLSGENATECRGNHSVTIMVVDMVSDSTYSWSQRCQKDGVPSRSEPRAAGTAGAQIVWGSAWQPSPSRRYLERATSMIFKTIVVNATMATKMPMMTVAIPVVIVFTSVLRRNLAVGRIRRLRRPPPYARIGLPNAI